MHRIATCSLMKFDFLSSFLIVDQLCKSCIDVQYRRGLFGVDKLQTLAYNSSQCKFKQYDQMECSANASMVNVVQI
jgi:hypothetical protein